MDKQHPNQNAGDTQKQGGSPKPEQGAEKDKNWNQPGSKNQPGQGQPGQQGGGQRPGGQQGGGQQGGGQGGNR